MPFDSHITKKIEDRVNDVIGMVFPNLNTNDKGFLREYLLDIIIFVAYKFNLDDKPDEYIRQLTQNDSRDLIGFLLMLLPFIDDSDGKKKAQIQSFDEIYIEKDEKESDVDINTSSPKYKYTNLQYGRCLRVGEGSGEYIEMKFNRNHLIDNHELLKYTIHQVSHKLYVNWINILPLSNNRAVFEKSTIYEKTSKYFELLKKDRKEIKSAIDESKNIKKSDDRFIGDNAHLKYGGLYIGDIYNTIFNYIYQATTKGEWLLIGEPPLLITLTEKFEKSYIHLLNQKWNQMDDSERELFGKEWELIKKSYKGEPDSELNEMLEKFNNSYSGIKRAIKQGYKKFGNDADSAERESSCDSIIPEFIFDFLSNSISEIMRTWFFNKMFMLPDNVETKGLYVKIPEGELTYDYGVLKKIYSNSLRICRRTVDDYANKKMNIVFDFGNGVKDESTRIEYVFSKKKKDAANTNFTNKLKENIKAHKKWAEIESQQRKFFDDNWIRLRSNFLKSQFGSRQRGQESQKGQHGVHKKLSFVIRIILTYLNKNIEKLEDEVNKVLSDDSSQRRLIGEASGIGSKDMYEHLVSLAESENKRKTATADRHWVSLLKEGKEWSKDKILRVIIGGRNQVPDINLSVIFDVMTFHGLLSEFVLNPELTDSRIIGDDPKEAIAKVKSKLSYSTLSDDKIDTGWGDCYYFLTNKKYKHHRITSENPANKGKEREMDYLRFLRDKDSGMEWMTFYAMDWVSQISFFHHYINNRVMLVTGATGVGKSTQVPKLLLYALRAIDYKHNGTIMCTQPRIPPTVANAKWISLELGVPIEQYNEEHNSQRRTHNDSIQYKHQNDTHTTKTKKLKLTIATDGTLYSEIKSNPLMKKETTLGGAHIFTKNNKYDTIIIDESHEHNLNMDLIMTCIKHPLHYNNDLRLVIISATMEEDEPLYRRFFRDINNNKKYPLDLVISDDPIDRTNIDIRLHISPPFTTTRFNIEERIRPMHNLPSTRISREDYQNKIKDIVGEILTESSTGDILIFQPGTLEIKQIIDALNAEVLPDNMIALPYHGQMPERKKKVIEDLDDLTRAKITIDKSVVFDENYDEDTVLRVSEGTYKRVIIVATNVAEASITIGTLKYVIDDGLQKTNYFDYETKRSKLITEMISNVSRVQRKGRVGRKSNGVIYYLYDIALLINSKTTYKISISDISEDICNLLVHVDEGLRNDAEGRGKGIGNSVLFPIDPNYKKLGNKIDADEKYIEVMKQYYYKGEGGSHLFYDDFIGGETVGKKPETYYSNGYLGESLMDEYGRFYFIHPNESDFDRNIGGDIVAVRNSNVEFIKTGNIGHIKSKKMIAFFELMWELGFITFDPYFGIVKSDVGLQSLYLKQNIHMTENIRYLMCYLYGRKYGCEDDISKLIPIMYQLVEKGKPISSIATSDVDSITGRRTTNIEPLRYKYESCYGDLDALLKIINSVLEMYGSLSRYYVESDDGLAEKKAKYFELKKKGLKTGTNDIDKDILDFLIRKDMEDAISNTKELTIRDKKALGTRNIMTEKLKSVIERNKEEIKRWCSNEFIDFNFVLSYLKSYMRFKDELVKYETYFVKNDEEDDEEDDIELDRKYKELEWFDKNIGGDYVSENKTVLAFAQGFKDNILRKLSQTTRFISTIQPNIGQTYVAKTINPYSDISSSLFKGENCHLYVLSIGMAEIDDELRKERGYQSGVEGEMFVVSPIDVDDIVKNFSGFYKNRKEPVYEKTKDSIQENICTQFCDTVQELKRDIYDKIQIDTKDGSFDFESMFGDTERDIFKETNEYIEERRGENEKDIVDDMEELNELYEEYAQKYFEYLSDEILDQQKAAVVDKIKTRFIAVFNKKHNNDPVRIKEDLNKANVNVQEIIGLKQKNEIDKLREELKKENNPEKTAKKLYSAIKYAMEKEDSDMGKFNFDFVYQTAGGNSIIQQKELCNHKYEKYRRKYLDLKSKQLPFYN